MLKIKRIYEKYQKNDGFRVLIDRLWPRGLTKEKAHVDLWNKNIAPSTKLRQWFGHEITKWEEFKKRYYRELQDKKPAISEILELLNKYDVTLLYGAKDEEHNDAVVLKDYLENK